MTRADFYVGTGVNAKYLGSVYADGDRLPASVKRARTPEKFEKAVARLIKKANGYTTWQWGWETSQATDFSYWLENEKLYVLEFGVGKKVIEKKRGRPATFERNWEMPTFTPALNIKNPDGTDGSEDYVTTGPVVADTNLKVTLS